MATKQAIILAGGKGTRLAKILGDKPKPLANIAGHTLLYYQLKALEKYGFKSVLILAHYKCQMIEEYIKINKFDLKIKVIFEDNPRGTAGALLNCFELLESFFLVLYGDTFFDIDLNRFYNFHQVKRNSQGTLLVHPNDHPADSDLVEINDENQITSFHKYPHPENVYFSNLVNAACYVLEKSILLDWINNTGFLDFGKDIFPKILEGGKKLNGYYTSEYIKDCGTPERLAKVEKHYYDGRVSNENINNKQKAVFLDRDGTINVYIDQLNDIRKFKLIDGVTEAIKIFNNLGYKTFVITNQPVVARGELRLEDLSQIHKKLETLLGNAGCFINKIYYCPHHPHKGFLNEIEELKIECQCRKPNTGMIQKAVQEFNIDLEKSWLVGDTTIDLKTAENAGLKSVLVLTGMAGKDGKYPESQPKKTVTNLLEFAHFLKQL